MYIPGQKVYRRFCQQALILPEMKKNLEFIELGMKPNNFTLNWQNIIYMSSAIRAKFLKLWATFQIFNDDWNPETVNSANVKFWHSIEPKIKQYICLLSYNLS